MKWITELSIANYRAFTEKETIKIPLRSHLLIYGENGSGKSSIFNALRDFFTSSDRTSQKLETNYFEVLNGNTNGSIDIEITDSSNPLLKTDYKFSEPDTASTHRNIQELLLANKVKGFLDYKRLLKTYFVESPVPQNPDLFDLLVEDILADHIINRIPGSSIPDNELSRQWAAIKTPLLKDNYDGKKLLCKTAVDNLPIFQNELLEVLKKVFVVLKRFISTYFEDKVQINVNISNMIFDTSKVEINKGIFLELKYAGQPIPSYHNFLNEARLSALATCIYLAALKTYPIDPTFEIRPLFLDDIFIGLDTSNRIPLLKLIKKEFMDYGYQVFISTYDRQWFELASNWFSSKNVKVKCLEMFVESDNNTLIPDKPVLLPFDGLLEKAEAHFKSKDYPTAGSYLRKECENIIKILLPDTYRITQECKEITELEDLLRQLKKLYDDSKVTYPIELIDSLKIYRKLILNPSSHNDMKSPLFRREIQDAIHIVKMLRQIPKIDRKKVLDKDQKLTISFPSVNYLIELEPDGDVWVTENNGTKQFSAFNLFIQRWTYQNVEFGTKDSAGNVIQDSPLSIDKVLSEKWTLEKVFPGLNKFLGIVIPADIYASVIIGSGGTLKDLLQ